ncbi:nucleotide-binding protein [Thermosulfuriphilus sp.]
MIIAVASGKGGTGKTTISVALAQVSEGPVRFLDADVEGPNSHLFLRPKIEKTFKVYLPVPEIDESRCTYCGQCREICRFSAITVIGQTILSFP